MAANPTRAKKAEQLHRGLSVRLDLKPGDEFTSWDFTSTSQDGSIGFRFASKTYESIRHGCGVDVSELSVHEHGIGASEREVLVLPGARFRVVDIFRPDPHRRPDFHHVMLERRPRLLQHDDRGRGVDNGGQADLAVILAAPSVERLGTFHVAINWPAAPAGVQRTDIVIHRCGVGAQDFETVVVLDHVAVTGGSVNVGADLWRSLGISGREAGGRPSGAGGGGGGAKGSSQPAELATRWWSPTQDAAAGPQLSAGGRFKVQTRHGMGGDPVGSAGLVLLSVPSTVALDLVFPPVVDDLSAQVQHTWEGYCIALDCGVAADGGAGVEQAAAVAYVKEGDEAGGKLQPCSDEVDVTEQYLALGSAVAAGVARSVLVRNVPQSWQGQRCVIDLRLRNSRGWNLPPPLLLRNGAAFALPHLRARSVVTVPTDSSVVPLRDPAQRRRLERAVRGGITAPGLVRTMAELQLDATSMPFGPDGVTLAEWAVKNGVGPEQLAALRTTSAEIVRRWGGGGAMPVTEIRWDKARLTGELFRLRTHTMQGRVRVCTVCVAGTSAQFARQVWLGWTPKGRWPRTAETAVAAPNAAGCPSH